MLELHGWGDATIRKYPLQWYNYYDFWEEGRKPDQISK
jgi:predicted LPLAT superfamily acyltransferase